MSRGKLRFRSVKCVKGRPDSTDFSSLSDVISTARQRPRVAEEGLIYATATDSSPMNRETFGAIEVTRADYQEMLRDALDVDARF